MVKNITLTLEGSLLEKARSKAMNQRKSLNELFREWVRQYVGISRGRSKEYQALMKKLDHVSAGRHFSREEMNER